jgi:transketolase
MFRAILDSVVLYPCDAVSTEKLVEAAITHRGISYLRTTRGETPVIYGAGEEFPIGGSKVLRKSPKDAATIVAAGITVPEALAAHDILAEQGISVRVVDCYSVKPLDEAVLRAAAKETPLVITVEDHYAQGGLGEAVAGVLAGLPARLKMLSVRAMPKSGKPAQLLDYEGISRTGIVEAVKSSIM